MRVRGRIGELLVPTIPVRLVPGKPPVACLVDSGFNGDLTAPRKFIRACRMRRAGRVSCQIASGKVVESVVYDWQITWFGCRRAVEVLESEALPPAVGLRLLVGLRLTINLVDWTVEISDDRIV